jgi:single-strand DNA-binding protein
VAPLRCLRQALRIRRHADQGAHLQVEGELRSREYDSKKTDARQRIWEIRVDSILKLDRAEMVSPEEQATDHPSSEEPAA